MRSPRTRPTPTAVRSRRTSSWAAPPSRPPSGTSVQPTRPCAATRRRMPCACWTWPWRRRARSPPGARRDRLELDLLTAQLSPLVPLGGYLAEEGDRVRSRALAVTTASGLPPPPPLLRSLALARAGRGDWNGTESSAGSCSGAGTRPATTCLRVEGAYVRASPRCGPAASPSPAPTSRTPSAWCTRGPARSPPRAVRPGPRGGLPVAAGAGARAPGPPEEAGRASADALALRDAGRAPVLPGRSRRCSSRSHGAGARRPRRCARARRADGLSAARGPPALTGQAFAASPHSWTAASSEGFALLHRAYADDRGVDRAPGLRAAITRQILWACERVGDDARGIAAAERILGLRDSAGPGTPRRCAYVPSLRAAQGASAERGVPDLERAIALAAAQGTLAFRARPGRSRRARRLRPEKAASS